MRWTRDFGPIFGLSRHDQLIAIDNVYRNLNRDLEEAAYQENDSFRRFITHQGDAMPGDLAVEIEERYEIPVELVRPPIMLDGGDFVHDGRGNVFISTQTLVRNGGNRHTLEELFRHYYGAKKLHVLQALPGATVAHLDMIFMPRMISSIPTGPIWSSACRKSSLATNVTCVATFPNSAL